jgi:hypothetical protein
VQAAPPQADSIPRRNVLKRMRMLHALGDSVN